MPKRVENQDLDRIAALLAPHKAGLGIAELEQVGKAAGLDFDRRTLQRRLADLIKAARVLKEGKGRASRYLPAPISGAVHPALEPPRVVARGEIYVPLSLQGAEVKGLVRRPISERKPVGYSRAFLESYEPNRSAYLPGSLRAHLHALGRSLVQWGLSLNGGRFSGAQSCAQLHHLADGARIWVTQHWKNYAPRR